MDELTSLEADGAVRCLETCLSSGKRVVVIAIDVVVVFVLSVGGLVVQCPPSVPMCAVPFVKSGLYSLSDNICFLISYICYCVQHTFRLHNCNVYK